MSNLLAAIFCMALLATSAAADEWTANLSFDRENEILRVQTEAKEGYVYELEQSPTLAPDDWTVVEGKTATSNTIEFIRAWDPLESRLFWRVVELGPEGEVIRISEVTAVHLLDSATSNAVFELTTESGDLIEEISIIENGLFLGEAKRVDGNLWSFQIPSDQVRQSRLVAQVRTEDGTSEAFLINEFLIAPPSKYVPLGSGGELLYGSVLQIEPDGTLAPFAFFPGKVGARETSPGAFFRFPEGAQFQTPTDGNMFVEFTRVEFYRGDQDTDPISVVLNGSQSTLDLGEITPESLKTALGLPSDAPVQLLWGSVPLNWQSGELDATGWSGLDVRAPGMPALLPEVALPPQVLSGDTTAEPLLVQRFYGDWPLGGGTRVTIKASDPLVFSLSRAGAMEAGGTVILSLPGGGELQGSLSWVAPELRVRIAARSLTLSSLGSLVELLPENVSALVPADPSEQDLDQLSEQLRQIHALYRGVAQGSQSELSAATPPAFGASPEVTSKSLLGTWAARIETWPLDQSKQLSPEDATNLRELLEKSPTEADALFDLDAALRQWLAARSLEIHLPGATSNSALFSAATDAVAAYASAAARILRSEASGNSSASIAPLLTELMTLEQPPAAPALAVRRASISASNDTNQSDAQATAESYLAQELPRFFAELGIALDSVDTDGSDNETLHARSVDQLISDLDTLRSQQETAAAAGLDQEYGFEAAIAQVLDALVVVSNRNYFEYSADGDSNHAALLGIVQDRGKILLRADALGLALDPFVPSTLDLLTEYQGQILESLQALPTADQLPAYLREFEAFVALARGISDPDLEASLRSRWIDFKTLINYVSLGAAGWSSICDELSLDLQAAGYPTTRAANSERANGGVDLTGKYEQANPTSNRARMLQINQAERYLRGWYQLHIWDPDAQRATLVSYDFEGYLLDSSETTFGYRLVNAAGVTNSRGILTMRELAGATEITLTPSSGSAKVFRQLSRQATMSDTVIAAFGAENMDVALATERYPFHTEQVERFDTSFEELFTEIENYFQFIDSADYDAEVQALKVGGSVVSMFRYFAREQQALARFRLQQLLQNREFSHGGQTRSAWEWLVNIYAFHQGLAVRGRAALGLPEAWEAGQHRYTVRINNQQLVSAKSGLDFFESIDQLYEGKTVKIIEKLTTLSPRSVLNTIKGLAADAVDGFVGDLRSNILSPDINLNIFQVEISKEGANGWGSRAESYIIVSLSAVAAVIDLGFESQGGTIELNLPFDYRPENFVGPVVFVNGTLYSATADVGTGDNPDEAATNLFLNGDGVFPFVTMDISDLNQKTGVALAALSLEIGGGYMFRTTDQEVLRVPDDTPTFTLRNFTSESDANSAEFIRFDVDSDEILACGWQTLRAFVAENRYLFDDPDALIVVRGFTDSTGSNDHNNELSQRRADRINEALSTLMDLPEDPELPRRYAVGLGEVDARNEFGDDADVPRWRMVEIEVGSLATMSLGEAGE